MEDLLIDVLSYFNLPVIRQGSMADDEKYPDAFFTFWNNASDDGNHYDNISASTIWNFDVNFYSVDPGNVSKMLKNAIDELRRAGFIVAGKGYDVGSDEPTHIGKGVNVLYLETNKED